MTTITRRDCMFGIAGIAAGSGLIATTARAQQAEIPPEGIGQGLRHLSYSDIVSFPVNATVLK